MAYAVKADVVAALPEEYLVQLCDDEGTGAQVDSRVAAAIEKADAEIDAGLGAHWDGETVPVILTGLSVDMAVYHLYARVAEEIPVARRDRYLDARRMLERGLNLDWPDSTGDPEEVKYRAV